MGTSAGPGSMIRLEAMMGLARPGPAKTAYARTLDLLRRTGAGAPG